MKKIKIQIFAPIFFFVFFSFGVNAAFAALSCTVSTTCNAPNVVVWKMYNTTNSHSELPSQNNYSYDVCCSGVTGLANTCTGNYATVLRLAGDTNAHAEENNQSNPNYDGHDACISAPGGDTISVGYQNNNCNGFDTTLASMATPPTNSHMGDGIAYTTKVCASVSTPVVTPSLCNTIGCGAAPLSSPPSPATTSAILKIADFNHDGKVDILDLSILLYYEDHPNSPVYLNYDLGHFGKIDFRDISILFYYWSVF